MTGANRLRAVAGRAVVSNFAAGSEQPRGADPDGGGTGQASGDDRQLAHHLHRRWTGDSAFRIPASAGDSAASKRMRVVARVMPVANR